MLDATAGHRCLRRGCAEGHAAQSKAAGLTRCPCPACAPGLACAPAPCLATMRWRPASKPHRYSRQRHARLPLNETQMPGPFECTRAPACHIQHWRSPSRCSDAAVTCSLPPLALPPLLEALPLHSIRTLSPSTLSAADAAIDSRSLIALLRVILTVPPHLTRPSRPPPALARPAGLLPAGQEHLIPLAPICMMPCCIYIIIAACTAIWGRPPPERCA